jgi:cell division protein FtsQ
MEPRIRVRRVQVRRQEGRRRLRVLVSVAVCATLVLAVWGATRSPLLDVDRIVVAGASQTGAAAVVKAGRVQRGEPMFDIDEGAVERRLRALPWVRSAAVRREWPGTLRVQVRERTAAAVMPATGGGWALVDVDGRVLSWIGAPLPGLLVIAGMPPAGQPGTTLAPAARGLLDVARVLPADLRPLVASATIEAGGISLGLLSHGTILVGEPVGLGEKLRAAELVIAGVDLTNLAVLDVRLPAAPTVTRRQP